MTSVSPADHRRHGRRSRSASCAGRACLALVLLAAPAAAETAPDPTWSALRDVLDDRRAPLVDLRLNDGTTLPEARPEPLLDRLGVDLPCGTPVLVEARAALADRHDLARGELEALLSAPALASPRQLALGDRGLVLVADLSAGSRHAAGRRDADRDGTPDVLAALADDARRAADAVADALGSGPADLPSPVHVVLAEWAYAAGSADARLVVLPRRLPAGAVRIASLAHQLAHVVLEDLEPELPPAFVEALATRIGRDAAGDDLADLRPTARAGARALLSPGLLSARDDAAFLAHAAGIADLADDWPGQLVASVGQRLVLERATAGVLTPASRRRAVAEALDTLLALRGSSLPDAVSSWHVTTLVNDLLEAGPLCPTDVELDAPADVGGDDTDVPVFGRLRLGITVPRDGGLEVAYDADSRTDARLAVLLDDGDVRVFLLDPDAEGEHHLEVPAAHVLAAVVLVTSPLLPDDLASWAPDAPAPTADFALSIAHDTAFPVVFGGFGSHVAPGQVTLEWTTDSEDGLVGWLVERAPRAGGPWRLLSRVPLPAFSLPGEAGSYAFVDPTVEPDANYHYRLVAVTEAGLAERSPVLTLRTLPRGPEPLRRPARD